MPCYHPVRAWRNNFSDLRERKRSAPFFKPPPEIALLNGSVKECPLPCGRCIGCRIERSRQWAIRGSCEFQTVGRRGAFLTLTYSPESLPVSGSLVKEHYQKFVRALRRRGFKFTYMFCGEYGERLSRPHYHAILFGVDFKDGSVRAPVRQSADFPLYSSPLLTSLWGKGHVVVGDVSFASIQYVASYVTKKVNGPAAKDHYGDRLPEFMQASLKTPIGKRWIEKFLSDVYPRDEFVFHGKAMRPPKFFQKYYSEYFPQNALDLSVKREIFMESRVSDNTPERLAAKKECTLAKFRQHVRRLEGQIV